MDKLIRITFKVVVLFILTTIVFSNSRLYGQDNCGADGKIIDTYCPCSDDPGLASICGFVSNANITRDTDSYFSAAGPGGGGVYATRKPVPGVTVSIWENSEYASTGKEFGNLMRWYSACTTTEKEGKFHCLTRRITPGNVVYVVFSCGNKVADVKKIASVKDFVGLDSDVDCSGSYTYSEPPSELSYVNRDSFLGCTAAEDTTYVGDVGFVDKPENYFSANTIEEGGAIRHAPFPGFDVSVFGIGFGLGYGAHNGTWSEKDCPWKFIDPEGGGLDLSVPLYNDYAFANLSEKCNIDPDNDGWGVMVDAFQKAIPWMFDLPNAPVIPSSRTWETRIAVSRASQDPLAMAQFNHLMFGDCASRVFLRAFGEDKEDKPFDCSELIKCTDIDSDPYRNIHTTYSLGARLSNYYSISSIRSHEERNLDVVICTDDDLGDVKISQIQPPVADVPCVAGENDCVYKLGPEYYMPEFSLMAGGASHPITFDATMGSGFQPQAPRREQWNSFSTEAVLPHQAGAQIRYGDDSIYQTNSLVRALRIGNAYEVKGGDADNFADALVGHADVISANETGELEYPTDTVLWDVGGDVQSLCTMSSVNEENILTTFLRDAINESVETLSVLNSFRGDAENHRKHTGAATRSDATQAAKDRDETLLNYDRWDMFDTLLRFASGSGQLETTLNWTDYVLAGIDAVVGEGIQKSFGQRTSDLNSDYPSRIEASYCLGQRDYDASFPPYGNNYGTYPGSSSDPSCYPWVDIGENEYCMVWPGPASKWPPPQDVLDNLRKRDGSSYSSESFPGIVDELQACKIGPNSCEMRREKRECTDFEDCCLLWQPNPSGPGRVCVELNPDPECVGQEPTHIIDCNRDRIGNESRACNTPEIVNCLSEQKDTWQSSDTTWEEHRWNQSGNDPTEPPELEEGDGWEDTFTEWDYFCDLESAGPLSIPGDLEMFQAGKAVQEPFMNTESQVGANRISDVANYTALSFTSPVESMKKTYKTKILDYATTNVDGSIQGSEFGGVQQNTAGEDARGLGTGSAIDLIKAVSRPERSTTIMEPFNDVYLADCAANGWDCPIIEPPGPIDLDSFDGGACRPDTNKSSCNVWVGDLAERIIGSAGQQFGVPGSILLAAIYGEGGWLPGSRMGWDDRHIASYSEPWYARMDSCNDQVRTAQGPYGHISNWFEADVAAGGYHPLRISPTNGQPVVSKCNFIDATYAAAKKLSYSFTGSCTNMTSDQIRVALAAYRSGVSETGDPYDPDIVPDQLVDIAMSCR